MPNRLGTADQAVCENCGGTVIVHLGAWRVPKGGKCRDCRARYNLWNVVELQPRPKFTGGVPPQAQRRMTGAVNSRERTAEPCSCGHPHFIALSSASQVCTGVCAPHAYTTGTRACFQSGLKDSAGIRRNFLRLCHDIASRTSSGRA